MGTVGAISELRILLVRLHSQISLNYFLKTTLTPFAAAPPFFCYLPGLPHPVVYIPFVTLLFITRTVTIIYKQNTRNQSTQSIRYYYIINYYQYINGNLLLMVFYLLN